ncbi:hypothetical protein [Nocardiopsis sp. CNT312]|uniref:hypothetical protein n=1 Tax=Nocardiopsis sp. CNT312 TaxID=1137268 RepID=UPI00048D0693|nr:hypothetical protein [Nocardiopsis sp. CNT312]
MIDITASDLLAAVRDALDVPPPGGADGHLPYLELVRERGAAARRALGCAADSGDLLGALDMVDGALSRLPVAYTTGAQPERARSIRRVV